jgi:hypothetical protein
MGTTLTGTTPATTYDSLIKVTDNGPLSGTAKYLSDGLGNDSVLALSTSRVGINQSTPTTARLEIVESTTAEALRVDGSGSGFALVVNGGTSYKSAIRNASIGASYFSTAAPSNGLIVEGNVGIGNSSPPTSFALGSSTTGLSFTSASSSLNSGKIAVLKQVEIGSGNGDLTIETYAGGGGGGERMRITSAGNVGIGTSSPLLNLSVVGVSGAESASATPNGSISIGPTGSNNQILTLGFLNGAGNHTWLQSRNSNQALFYPLILNPSGGNVGIGKTNPTALRPDAAGSVACAFEVSGNGSAGIRITDSSAVNRYLDISVDDNVAEIGAYYSTTPTLNLNAYGSINFKRQNTTIATITANGLTFNGDTAAANALDDYEEGTWTPTLGGTWSTNPTGLTGLYTKIGNMVYIRLEFTGGVKASNVSGWFDGLPFSGAEGGGGTVSNVNVEDKGIVLLDNSTRVWTTVSDFGVVGTKVMAFYRV